MMARFRLHIDDTQIADRHERLARTRWSDQPQGDLWATGADLAWLQQLARYWHDEFDWRPLDARLNAFEQWRRRCSATRRRCPIRPARTSGSTCRSRPAG
ncbi:epoxide hydrolase N-terminal domain-containing protein [Caldimonas thermodepolymerans]|uniref:epoxide hydrolase N-terminal domain-containing protein n=1 Tax=Caldimonas thermodepolymerans TaxID=215580 RepID=UPI003AFA4573